MTHWTDDAACKGLTALFYPDPDKPQVTYTAAKRICASCPVQAPCAEAGAGEVHGVWGGLSPNERSRGRSRSNPWHHNTRAKALRLAAEGNSDRDVSLATGVPRPTVRLWRRQAGLVRRSVA